MKSTQDLIFSVDRTNRKIHVEKRFAVSREELWNAFTRESIISQWFAPRPWQVESKEFDFSEVGRWLFAMLGPEGEKHWSFVEFISISPYEKYVAKDGFSDEDGNIDEELPQSTWHANFKDQADFATYELDLIFDTEEDFDTNLKMGFQEGFTLCLDQLEKLLA